jgi:cyclin-dependent kinase 2
LVLTSKLRISLHQYNFNELITNHLLSFL